MSAVLFAFGTGTDVAIPLLVGGWVLGVIVYAGVMVATGELTRAELVSAWRRVRAALRRA